MNVFSLEIRTTIAFTILFLLALFALGNENNEIEVSLGDWVDGDVVWVGVRETYSAPDET